MASLQDAIDAVQDIMGALTGIKAAPDEPLEQFSQFPFAVCYADHGEWDFGPAGDRKGLHTLVLELHVARKDLPRDIAAAMAYSDIIPNALLKDPTLAGTVSTIVGPLVYTFGPMGYGNADKPNTLGFRFMITVKMQATIT